MEAIEGSDDLFSNMCSGKSSERSGEDSGERSGGKSGERSDEICPDQGVQQPDPATETVSNLRFLATGRKERSLPGYEKKRKRCMTMSFY